MKYRRLIATSAIAIMGWSSAHGQNVKPAQIVGQPRLESRLVPLIDGEGLRFRDLNRDGQLNPFEDWRLTPDARAKDLAARMTLPEKAGTMMHGSIPGMFESIWKHPVAKYLGVLGLFMPVVVLIYYCYIESWTLAWTWASLRPDSRSRSRRDACVFFDPIAPT